MKQIIILTAATLKFKSAFVETVVTSTRVETYGLSIYADQKF